MRQQNLFANNKPNDPKDEKDESTHDMIMASSMGWDIREYVPDYTGPEEEAAWQDVVIGKWSDDFRARAAIHDNWKAQAGVEPMGIFRPFDTEPQHPTMGSFISLAQENYSGGSGNYGEVATSFDESSGQTTTSKFYSLSPMPPINDEYHMPITVTTLNPFKGKGLTGIYGFDNMNDSESMRHDIDYVVRGNTWPVGVNLGGMSHGESYRAMALRGPLILSGWGFDIDGKPVPAAPAADGKSPSKFLDDWLVKPHKWKTGPLDVRWDDDRGVWTAPPSFKLLNAKCCECVGPATSKGGWFQLVDESEAYNKDGEDVEGVDSACNCDTDSEQVFAMNRTGKVVLPDAKVLLYYDTRKHTYYIITAPDPIVIAKMNDLMTPDETTEKATIEKGIHGLGTFNSSCGNIVQVTNTLKQPICKDSKAFIYLTKCNSSASDGGSDDYNFEGEVLQAEFEPLTVVTSVDCYEHPDSGEPTLEICDRRIYVQTAYTIEDCGDDTAESRNETKGWRPGVDFDGKKNKDPEEGDFCPSDWNKDKTG